MANVSRIHRHIKPHCNVPAIHPASAHCNTRIVEGDKCREPLFRSSADNRPPLARLSPNRAMAYNRGTGARTARKFQFRGGKTAKSSRPVATPPDSINQVRLIVQKLSTSVPVVEVVASRRRTNDRVCAT